MDFGQWQLEIRAHSLSAAGKGGLLWLPKKHYFNISWDSGQRRLGGLVKHGTSFPMVLTLNWPLFYYVLIYFAGRQVTVSRLCANNGGHYTHST